MAEEENIASFVRRQHNGVHQPSLGDIVRTFYKGEEVSLSDVIQNMRRTHYKGQPLLKIMKRRASYKRYLRNRMKRETALLSLTPPKV